MCNLIPGHKVGRSSGDGYSNPGNGITKLIPSNTMLSGLVENRYLINVENDTNGNSTILKISISLVNLPSPEKLQISIL